MTLSDQQLKDMKEQCLGELREALPGYYNRLLQIDERLLQYAEDVTRQDIDIHNIDEILGLRKFLRMLYTYPFNIEKVRRVYRAYESLEFSGLKGRTRYALTNVQCMMLAGVFGFEREDGRRKVTDAIFYIVRKFCKTTMGAFFQFWFFFFEDYNNEGYCVANSSAQSAILFNLAYDLIHQLDPNEKRIRFTKSLIEWKKGQSRAAKIEALSAGGKTKDGLFAGLCCADEYGSAPYINEKSDMGQLVSVVEGSMGPRREPLTLTTTTAGRITAGPFKDKLEGVMATLREEMGVPLDRQPHPMQNDWQYAIVMHPDQWEQNEESCRKPEVWRKCNPHIGITVQEDYYANEWLKMDKDEEKKKENLCKLFNVYQSDKTRDWISADQIRRLQVPLRIDQCTSDEGWTVFVGMDFSMGDDLHAMSFLAWRENPQTGEEEFFADMEAWMTSASVASSSLKLLLQKWGAMGHLHIVQGETLEPNIPVDRLVELYDKGVLFKAFGYDPYKAKTPINTLKAWVYSEGADPKDIVLPVRQNFATYNPLVEEMDYMVKAAKPLIHFADNPLWPWEFQNCVLMESNDGMGNVKPCKGSSVDAKVDNVQALLSALSLFDMVSGKEET